MSNCKQRYHVVRYICCLLLITNNHTWQCYESNYCLFSFTTMLCAQVCCWLLCSYGVLFEVSIVGQKQLSPHNAQFQPNHTIVVTKHFRTLTSSFTEIHELGKYQFSKEKFPHSFSLLLSVSFFYPRHREGGARCVLCARDIRHGDVLPHLELRDHWMAYNTSASALYRCVAPRMQSRDWFAHWLIHMSADREVSW